MAEWEVPAMPGDEYAFTAPVESMADLNMDAGFGRDDAAGFDGQCNECQGHRAKDCPSKKCFNCSLPGHTKADCTNEAVEREFTGDCNVCGQAGHRARDCPDKPADVCRLCFHEGHKMMQCTAKRDDLWRDAQDMDDKQAWAKMVEADKNKDFDDFRPAFFAYIKKMNTMAEEGDTAPIDACALETAFRDGDFNLHLIAKEKPLDSQYTYVSVAGEIGQKFHLTLEWSAKPRRPIFSKGWPKTTAENLERLNQSGFPLPTHIPKCDNCLRSGHVRKHCKEEAAEKTYQAPTITCVLCKGDGHRARDCDNRPAPKADARPPRACHNCGADDHMKSECPNPRVIKCLNCLQAGHVSRECTEPKDWSKVRCRNCLENGHGAARCPAPPAEPAAPVDAFTGGHDADADAGFGAAAAVADVHWEAAADTSPADVSAWAVPASGAEGGW